MLELLSRLYEVCEKCNAVFYRLLAVIVCLVSAIYM